MTVQSQEPEKIEVFYRQLSPLSHPMSGYAGFKPGITVLPKGYTHEEGRMPFPCETIYERDVAVKMRDGITIYVDIYRPVGSEKVPAIVSWGPAGKRGQNNMLDRWGSDGKGLPRMGVPRNATSGLQGWEASDPAHWVPYQYAIVTADPRGAYMSEGDCQYFGYKDAEDGYDFIEWLAVQDWCNGKIAMAGNSWFAITQMFIASLQPPHLAAIAPWEAMGDLYRDWYLRGGIPRASARAMNWSFGSNRIEDIDTMVETYPLMNSYWEGKIPRFERIEVPAYMVGSYTSSFHVRGTIKGFNSIASKDKWLRIHNRQEWPDLYDEKNREDLRRFFDHYLKGINNDWEKTPRVRMSVLDPGGTDIVGRPENEFPLARQESRKLYLDAASGNLSTKQVPKEAKVSYNNDNQDGKTDFTIQFDEETEITGFSKLRLWVEADGAKDMDLFARIIKLDENGKPLFHDALMYQYSGPDGRLRVSLRRLDPGKSTPSEPYHTFRVEESLKHGEIAPVEIQIWPTSMIFHAGQQLQLAIAGFDYALSKAGDRGRFTIRNRGNHIIHTGGQYDSYLLIPVIPSEK